MVAIRAAFICKRGTSWQYYKIMSKVNMSETKGLNTGSLAYVAIAVEDGKIKHMKVQ